MDTCCDRSNLEQLNSRLFQSFLEVFVKSTYVSTMFLFHFCFSIYNEHLVSFFLSSKQSFGWIFRRFIGFFSALSCNK